MKLIKRKSASKTPAPKKDRVYGSKTNKALSASSASKASSITFSEAVLDSISTKVSKYNSNNPNKKISMATAKAVVRRGFGAYSSTHRPTISGGQPNSRVAWGLARLSAFMRKKSGSQTANGSVNSSPIKKTYVQDDDLL
jgi:hypothetical protein